MKNKRYVPNEKNGGHPPKCTDDRKQFVPIPCGKCIECMNDKKRNWQIRLHEEIKNNELPAQFVTLSMSEESIEELAKITESLEANEIARKAVRLFLERWRKEYKKSVKHWFVTELGHENTERVHIHGIMWTDKVGEIEQKWKYGNVYIGDYCNAKTINYIVKYIVKIDTDHPNFQPKVFPSPGLGAEYLNGLNALKNRYSGKETRQVYQMDNGAKINLPKYYKNKLWTENERDRLWTKTLDQQEQYVMGTKIKTENIDGLIEVEKSKGYYQTINERIGYAGSTWEKKEYVASKTFEKTEKTKK